MDGGKKINDAFPEALIKMKLSFVVSLQDTKFKSIAKGKWEEKIALLADLGYDGVEFGIRDPKKVNIDDIEKTLTRYDLELSAIGSGQAYVDDGLSLSSINAEVRNKAIDRLRDHIELARIFNTQVIIGLIRGEKEGPNNNSSTFENNLYDSFKRVCHYASAKKVILTLEPLNRYETDLLNTVDETLIFIKKSKCRNLKILLDTFHMNIEEKDFIASIKKAKDYLSHVHLADSNRRYPGEGHINFEAMLRTLKQIGYVGYLSGEMLPLPSFEICANQYIQRIKPYLQEKG